MKCYGVKELAALSGISVRTLHYYDKIGLLKPANRSEAGYRFYGEEELLRLQQILFFKELDFPLREINELLDEPSFDLLRALENHKAALRSRKKRISKLLSTIDNTIENLKTGVIMSKPEMLYDGLPKEVGTTYRQEAIEKYGKKAVARSEKKLSGLGKDGFKQLQSDFEQLNQTLFALRAQAPDSIEVQELIARHYEMIRQFWGTATQKDKQAEPYAGLGQLYVNDERFVTIDGQPRPEFAVFLQKAMRYFADTELK